MKLAIKQAKKAFELDEVPIGAVIVIDDKVIAKAHNQRNKTGIATKHAEIIAIEKACKKLGDWRLENAEIYVTLEPCPMCAGAIANARIKTLIYACEDTTGTNKNLINEILSDTRLNHKTEILRSELAEECRELLSNFFKSKRKK